MTPEEMQTKVQTILDAQINPGLAGHGGVCNLVGVKESKVYLRFGGGCQGCGMVSATLQDGIEQMLRSEIPEIAEIVDVTAHEEGQNPFY